MRFYRSPKRDIWCLVFVCIIFRPASVVAAQGIQMVMQVKAVRRYATVAAL